jgi:hypothetical protein
MISYWYHFVKNKMKKNELAVTPWIAWKYADEFLFFSTYT